VQVELQPCAIGLVETAIQDYTVCEPCKVGEFWDFPGSCHPCDEEGMDCGLRAPLPQDEVSMQVGRQIYTILALPIERGYFRFHASSREVYKCPDEERCTGDHCACAGVNYELAFNEPSRTHGEALCHSHSYGPLCARCKSGFYRRSRSGGCAMCKADLYTLAAYIVITSFILGLAAFFIHSVYLRGGEHPLVRHHDEFCGLRLWFWTHAR